MKRILCAILAAAVWTVARGGAGSPTGRPAPIRQHLRPSSRKRSRPPTTPRPHQGLPLSPPGLDLPEVHLLRDAGQGQGALGSARSRPFPVRPLGTEMPKAAFGQNMTDEQIAAVKEALVAAAGSRSTATASSTSARPKPACARSSTSPGRWASATVVCEPADDDFTLLEKLVEEYDIQIAIHNHPAPAKYAYPRPSCQRRRRQGAAHRLLRRQRALDARRDRAARSLQVCSKAASSTSTSRTGATSGRAKGVDDVAWGTGKAGLRDLLAELTLQDYDGYLTMEYENEAEVGDPSRPSARASTNVKSLTYYEGYTQILRSDEGGYEKYGWNHYGPGGFRVRPEDRRSSRARAAWACSGTAKKSPDFILECDFKCSTPTTNSGIFLRVPGRPVERRLHLSRHRDPDRRRRRRHPPHRRRLRHRGAHDRGLPAHRASGTI